MVAAGVADEMLVQLSYAIGVAKPLSIFVNTVGTSRVDKSDGEIAAIINECFDLRPAVIIEKFGLKILFIPPQQLMAISGEIHL